MLFKTGRYRDIRVAGTREGDTATLIYDGTPRYFVGRVTIVGVKMHERLASLLEYATKLEPGAEFTDADIKTGTDGVRQALETSGYFQATVTPTTALDEAGSQVNAIYTVNIGPQARVGLITLEGKDLGLTVEEVRKKGKLKQGTKVNRDTVSNALTRLRSQYQKNDRLEATTSLRQQTYNQARKQLDYDFNANQGPVVKVTVEGTSLSKSKLKLLVPIYEEGTIDNDLLNEGAFNIKDFLFQQGYFDATVAVRVIGADTPSESVVFSVVKGVKHKVAMVTITGIKYFDTDLLKERMQVQKADAYLRNGRYSPQLMKADVDSILAVYRANGFMNAAICRRSRTSTHRIGRAEGGRDCGGGDGDRGPAAEVRHGNAQRRGGQPPQGHQGAIEFAAGPALLADYALRRPRRHAGLLPEPRLCAGARLSVKQQPESGDPQKMDVALNVTEGQQVFVDKVLLSGIEHTRPAVVDRQVKVHAGDPLDQSALAGDAAQRLYGLALFNEVNAAVQNPDGRRSAEERAAATNRGATVGRNLRLRASRRKPGSRPSGKINPASAILLGFHRTQPTRRMVILASARACRWT